MKTQMPEIERPENDPLSDSIERHPAYGQIQANRWTSGTKGVFLYGSDFRHNAGVSVTISRSELHRGLSNDWPFSREELIEVNLSEAQWATFVSSLNNGTGPQCTLSHIAREGVPQIERVEDRKKQFKLEASESLKDAEAAAEKLSDLIEKGGKKSEMRDAIRTIKTAFSSHSGVSFIAEQFGEHLEKTTEYAKVEINAYVTGVIQRAGLKALGGAVSPIELPDKDGA